MWSRLREFWDQLRSASATIAPPAPPSSHQPLHRLVMCAARADAQATAQSPRLVAVFSSAGKPKWAYLMCPCGCGAQLALNLMPSHRPVWRIIVRTETDFTIFPSVDSTTCGAHFWLRSGRIMWSA